MENDSDQNHSSRTSNTIQAIDKKTVHQICSGQVVLDLATAVKELVENSVDAGATNIEIRLKEFGKELVEVSDNGEGIKESDFEALALKHYTSKLRQFNDLPSVSTFGFRGEALSSLSALGDLTITTHHASCEIGSKLTFNHDGKLADKGFAAREIGTTVCISNLFYTLPVRYKEFHRNYKKDFARLMNILYAFCLVNSTVRFSCINQVAKKKNLVLSSSGKNDTLNIISSIFGSNQVKNVIKIEQKEPTETILEEYNLSKKVCSEYANLFCLQGYISSITHGCGRSTSDRQFVFINKRPCDFPKLSRVINDVYHMFNRHQYPFVFLNISLNKDYVDVNVTPDKRQIMIQQENVLFVIVKSSLKFIFEHNSTCYVENNKSKDYAETPVNSTSISTFITSTPQSKSHEKNTDGEKLCENLLTPSSMSKQYSTDCSLGTILSSPLDRFRSKYEKPCLVKDASFVGKKTPDQCKLQSYFSSESKKRKQQSDGYIGSESKAKKAVFPSEGNSFHESDDDLSAIPLNESNSSMNESMENNVMSDIEVKNFENETLCKNETNLMPHKNELHSVESRVDNEKEGLFNESKFEISISSAFEANHGAYDHHVDDGIDIKQSKCEHDDNVVIVDEIGIDKMFREKVVSSFNLAKLRENYSKYILDKSSKEESNLKVSSFRAKISTCDNQCAEEELGKNVTKEMFLLMDIIGQFNLGFIITKLNEDLFIVDQHASDEKYNYETLQQKHCLKGQRLIQPLPVKLTSVNEAILLENLEVFEKNGFEFDIKEETSSHEDNASRIHLLTVPTSRNWTFSIDDVEELVYLLGESPGMCRPSRVHKMFASRACRTSVMVGTALNKQKMRTLVKHMSEIDQPWNCPHGRPTMRHLINLERIQCND